MEQTKKMLDKLITEESKKMTLEQLAEAYQKELNPIYFATIFNKMYNLIINLSNHYYGLNKDDIASFALEKLDYSLRTYDGVHKFSTWYTTILKNKFREETESLNYKKRKVVFFSDSYDELLKSGFDLQDNSFTFNDINSSINLNKLSQQEILFCNLLANYYSKNDVMKIMNLTKNNYYYLKNKLKKNLILT